MATYRNLRIAPDMPNHDPDFDDDTPPASPYQNKLPPRRNVFKLSSLSITLPSTRVLGWVAFAAMLVIFVMTPRQYKPKVFHPTHSPSLRYKNVDWRMFAYTTYAMDQQHVCAAMMIFSQLEELGSKAERVMFYPEDWDKHPDHRPEHVDTMMKWARSIFNVKTKPVKVHGIKQDSIMPEHKGLHRFMIPNDEGQLDPSITKFLALSQTHYLRVIHIDPHVSIQQHLDDLFLGPPARLGLTRRYLTNPTTRRLSAHLMVIDPREEDAASLFDLSQTITWENDYFDSQVLTEQSGDYAMILSHRVYGLNSAEFRREDHFDYFGNEWEEWNPERAKREASIILFDERLIPKPWVAWPQGMPEQELPYCSHETGSENDIGCRNRAIWLGLYNDYRKRRKDVCRMIVIPGGKWEDDSAVDV